jgi:predicted transcriptional regulator
MSGRWTNIFHTNHSFRRIKKKKTEVLRALTQEFFADWLRRIAPRKQNKNTAERINNDVLN